MTSELPSEATRSEVERQVLSALARGLKDDAVARHITSFWAPAMIRDLRSHIAAGGADVDSVARDAIESIP